MFRRYLLAPIALAGVLIGSAPAAFAQTPAPDASAMPAMHGMRGHHHRHHHRGWHAALAGLSLTADQRAKIDATMRADHTAFRASADTQSPEARRAEREKMRADIESALTPDQKTQFEAAMKHHRRAPNAVASPGA